MELRMKAEGIYVFNGTIRQILLQLFFTIFVRKHFGETPL